MITTTAVQLEATARYVQSMACSLYAEGAAQATLVVGPKGSAMVVRVEQEYGPVWRVVSATWSSLNYGYVWNALNAAVSHVGEAVKDSATHTQLCHSLSSELCICTGKSVRK